MDNPKCELCKTYGQMEFSNLCLACFVAINTLTLEYSKEMMRKWKI